MAHAHKIRHCTCHVLSELFVNKEEKWREILRINYEPVGALKKRENVF